ncbi:MAG: hypothetical protein N2C14_16615, partial [Planctomycetales bacterium]
MLKTLLGIDETQQVDGTPEFFLAQGWLAAAVLVAVALVIAAYLYRSETRLTGQRRFIMGACKFLALL